MEAEDVVARVVAEVVGATADVVVVEDFAVIRFKLKDGLTD